MRNGIDGTRRNRNIGTVKQGRGSDNKLRIPSVCQHERIWWEQIRNPTVLERIVEQRPIRFFMEPLRAGFIHACSVNDVCALLSLLPASDWEGIGAFIFRQPTRKQTILNPVWGRLAMAADIGEPDKPNRYSGPALILEAVDISHSLHWDRSLSHAAKVELEKLRTDAHCITEDRRGYTIRMTGTSARRTQLFRTIPHEVGHWVDWLKRVERPFDFGSGDNYADLADAYWARPRSEREAFAHHYATGWYAPLLSSPILNL